MKISDLIASLEEYKVKFGDAEVVIESEGEGPDLAPVYGLVSAENRGGGKDHCWLVHEELYETLST